MLIENNIKKTGSAGLFFVFSTCSVTEKQFDMFENR